MTNFNTETSRLIKILYGRKEDDGQKSERSFGKPGRWASSLGNVHNNGNVEEVETKRGDKVEDKNFELLHSVTISF
jgi:hypothetical protein